MCRLPIRRLNRPATSREVCAATLGATPAWNPATSTASGPTYPRMGDQAVPAGHTGAPPQGGHTTCSGCRQALPERYTAADPDHLAARIRRAKAELGPPADHPRPPLPARRGDGAWPTPGATRSASPGSPPPRRDAEFVVFCGVHFMAESADILTGPDQQVILPDLNAGCSMADMADIDSVEEAWEALGEVTDLDRVVPVTYMNSSAALKAFVGRHGGVVCTSSNARAVLTWALGGRASGGAGGHQVLFFPDQHLGRNTGFQLGYTAEEMAVWNPRAARGGLDDLAMKSSVLLLWKGHCSVHQRFRPEQVAAFRAEHRDGLVFVHPECAHEVVEVADQVGSTDYLIRAVGEAPSGSVIGVGTEIHLVKRLDDENPDKTVLSLDPLVCPCSTMFRIDLPHLAWVLDALLEGEVRNRVTVDEETARWARVALERMLATV